MQELKDDFQSLTEMYDIDPHANDGVDIFCIDDDIEETVYKIQEN
jgi:hypothetical protein